MNIENEISKDLGLEIVRLEVSEEDRQVEGALRPKTLEEFVGQHRVREQLDLILRAALQRGNAADHVLLSGPPGLGKTTLATIVASELGSPIRVTSVEGDGEGDRADSMVRLLITVFIHSLRIP